jgi:DNA-binding GntR family transcriptional regulator
LRRAIVTGELRPGERLVTTALAERWSVSPTPVREALKRLAAEGLVEMSSHSSARVAPISLREFTEICEVRFVLEPLALEESLRRRDAKWKAALADVLDVLRQELKRDAEDLLAFEEAHRAFHRVLLSGCPSEVMLRIIDMLTEQSVRYRLLSFVPRGGPTEVLREHEQLFRLCTERGAKEAVELLRRHLQRTLDTVVASSANLDDTEGTSRG